jgi:methyl-accepting chemotaxis protein
MRFKDRKLKTKLLMGFAVVLVLMVVIGGSGLYKMGQIQRQSEDTYENQLLPITELAQVRGGMLKVRATILQHVLAREAGQMQEFEAQIKELDAQVDKALDSLAQAALSPEEKETLATYKEAWANFKEGRNNQTLRLSAEGKKDEAMKVALGPVGQLFKKASDAIDTLILTKKKIAQATVAAGNQQYATSKWIIVLTLLGGIALSLFLSFFLTGMVAHPIAQVAARVEQLRSLCITNLGCANEAMMRGDLNYKIVTGLPMFEAPALDEVGQLETSINGIIKQTQDTVASFEQSRQIVLNLLEQTRQLALAVRDGQLEVRGDTAKFEGAYRELMTNVNELIEGVATPLSEVSHSLDRLAAQDLTTRVKSNYKGEYEKLKNSVNKACEALEQTLSQVSSAAEQVNSAANEINSGSQSLAQGASEQASSLEEVASSLQEMNSMIKQNAANAKEARGLTEAARLTADKGVMRMQQLSEAVNRIKQSSDATAKIVKTIDEIAFQTNLLALNAAVEAARAGDAGKGFAVVAEEVRNLAMRSAEAAKNTAELIEQSVKNAEGGVAINAEVLTDLEEINRQVNQVTEVMAEIAAASEQQSQGVEQINAAIGQMNQVTQQAAANSEESAAAAEELSGQSEELMSLVAAFQISHSGKQQKPGKMSYAPKPLASKPMVKAKSASASFTPKSNSFSGGEDLIPFDDMDSSAALQGF